MLTKLKQTFGSMNFNIRKILAGEEATPNTFNRGLIGAMDSDSELDQAIQFTDRSVGLISTEATSFLCHFDNGLETDIMPVTYTTYGQTDNCVNNDGTFRGQFWSFKTNGNLMGSISDTDSSLTTLKGWNVNGNDIGRCIIRSTSAGTQIRNYLRGGSSAAGTFTLTPTVDINVSSLTNKTISIALKLATNADIDISKCTFAFGFQEFDASNNVVADTKQNVTSSSVKAMLKVEGVSLNAATTKIRPYISVTFSGTGSFVDVTVKDFMIANAGYVGGYAPSSNVGTGVKYIDCISTNDEQNTVIIKGLLNKNYIATATSKVGPLFLVDSTTNKGFGLVVTSTGVSLEEINFADGTTIASGSTIPVTDAEYSQYILFGIRFGKTKGEIHGFMVTADGAIYTSVLPYADTYKNKMLSLGLGQFIEGISNFEGPLTELRVDREWLNDQQVQVAALSNQAFVNSKTSVLTQENIYDILDSVGINKLVNPDGRLWLNHWSPLPGEDKFTNFVGSPALLGSGFKWIGGYATQRYVIGSEFMEVTPNKTCRFRAKMMSVDGTTGKFGIGIQYYSAKNDTATVGTMMTVYSRNGADNEYYTWSNLAPEGVAYAKVFMLVEPGLNSTAVYWSRMKFEQSEEHATEYSDDSSPKYAVYASGQYSYNNELNQTVVTIVGPKGDTGPQGPQGIQGVQGPQGPQGPAGTSAVLSSSLGENGRVVYSDGHVEMWGIANVPMNQSISNIAFVNQFGGACYNVQATIIYDTYVEGTLSVYIKSWDTTGFSCVGDYTLDPAITTSRIFWRAIGSN